MQEILLDCLTAAAVYVVPVFWFYIRAEERMLSSEIGAHFETYTHRVGRLIPRLQREREPIARRPAP